MYIKSVCIMVMTLCLSYNLLCQTSTDIPADYKMAIGVDVFYIHPNIDEFNAGLSKVEGDLGLHMWNDFGVYYLVVPTVSYEIDQNNQLGLQAGGSFAIRTRDDGNSYYYLWMLGGQYQHTAFSTSSKKFPMDIRISIGAGLLAAQFYRSYSNDIALYAYSRKPYVDGGVTIDVKMNKRMSLNADVRYLFVPTMKFDDLQTELKLKSFMIGVGYTYLL